MVVLVEAQDLTGQLGAALCRSRPLRFRHSPQRADLKNIGLQADDLYKERRPETVSVSL